MAKRLLDCYASDFQKFTKADLLESVLKSEGRVLVCESIGTLQPMLGNVTNAEFTASMGADIILLNMFDVWEPTVKGLPEIPKEETIRKIKSLTGRPVGLNLEPVEEGEEGETEPMWKMSAGRRATVENALQACRMGADMLVLTGNPGMGVSNEGIKKTLEKLREAVGDKMVLAAGKMHAAGVLSEAAQKIITKEDVKGFVRAGADIILLPAPATVPGITVEYVKELVDEAHRMGALTITAIGTSQEGADTDTVKRLALMCKMTGTDMHHLGDAGYAGMSLPENIFAYSVAIRGIRHTYHRMAASVTR